MLLSLTIKEMQIRTKDTCYLTPVRTEWLLSKRQKITRARDDVEESSPAQVEAGIL
jgi:hypothetical protein